jgi:succinate dehydrogenase / fumarate reductase cytochrome b subunit
MRVGGVILLLFIVFHLLHFTTGTIFPGATFVPGAVGRNVIVGFETQPLVAGFYVVAMIALGLHLSHGIWSFFQTLGLNHPTWNRARRVTAWVLTIVIAGGLMAIPLGVMAGFAGRAP